MMTFVGFRLTGNNLVEQMARGIDRSVCVVVCITSKYICKVGGLNGGDNCKKEFIYAEQVCANAGYHSTHYGFKYI